MSWYGKWWQVVFFRQVSTRIPSDGKKIAHIWCLLKTIFPRIQPTITGRFLNDMDSWKVRSRASWNRWFVTFRGIRLTGRGLLTENLSYLYFLMLYFEICLLELENKKYKAKSTTRKKSIPQFSVTKTNIAQSRLWCILKQIRRLHAERHAEPQAFPTPFFFSFVCFFQFPELFRVALQVSEAHFAPLRPPGKKEVFFLAATFMKAGRCEEQKMFVCVCARENEN